MRMTYDEMDVRMNSITNDQNVHPKLAAKLRSIADDRGHSAGCDEVLGIFQEMVFEFAEINELLNRGN